MSTAVQGYLGLDCVYTVDVSFAREMCRARLYVGVSTKAKREKCLVRGCVAEL